MSATRDPAVSVRGVSKRFRLHRERPTSVKEALLHRRRRDIDDFWALKDVSFDIEQGSFFGLIGHNGSGKSTILRLMAGIHEPTEGIVTTDGRISALLELGTGFHPDLTGRENVFLNGAMLGLSRRRMTDALDDIIEFSGLGDFMDVPMKVYSSGMVVRLGFAVAINVDPEILLVDEVIAVGDEQFQRRCLDHMFMLRRQGVTIVLVSHSGPLVESLCDRVAWLDHGELQMVGDPVEVVGQYLARVNQQEIDRLEADAGSPATTIEVIEAGDPSRRGSGEIRAIRLDLLTGDGVHRGAAQSGDPLVIRLWYEATETIVDLVATIGINDEHGRLVSEPSSRFGESGVGTVPPGQGYIDIIFDRMLLLPGSYTISTSFYSSDELHCFDAWDKTNKMVVQPGSSLERNGLVELRARWEQRVERAIR